MHRFESKALERIFRFALASVADSAGFIVFADIWWRLGGTAVISEMTQFHVFILIVILSILLSLPLSCLFYCYTSSDTSPLLAEAVSKGL